MKNFFSEIQGKFDAKYHGRYLGNIIEQIAAVRKEVADPLLKVVPTKNRWTLKSVQEVTSESAYLTGDNHKQDRWADLEITLDSGDKAGSVLVEIKVKDNFLPGQLEEYINWAKGRSEKEDRAIIILTAFPIKNSDSEHIKINSEFIKHIYISDFIEALRSKVKKSELIALFSDYICKEGYAMYQLQPRTKDGQGIDDTDYKALSSFMVLTFLPHNSGKGKVASAKKIAHGPAVFSNIIQNWQLVSDRFEVIHLTDKRRPTIRYFPEQAANLPSTDINSLDDGSIFSERKRIRNGKQWGRYWLTSDTVLDDSENLRLEWGQIIQIQQGKDSEEETIKCKIFACIRKGQNQIGGKIILLKDGIKSHKLYSIELFMNELLILARAAKTQAIKKDQESAKKLNECLNFD